jgi:hypothetical protein
VPGAEEGEIGKPPESVVPEPTPKTEAAEVAKEPWEMTRDEYLNNETTATGRDPDSNIDNRTPVTIRKLVYEQHYKKVYRALRRGKPVSAEVLKDYPELAAKKPDIPLKTTQDAVAVGEKGEPEKPPEVAVPTKRDKALAEYRDYIDGLTDAQRQKVAGLIIDNPISPGLLKRNIEKALATRTETENKPEPGKDPEKQKAPKRVVNKLRAVAEKSKAKAQEIYNQDRLENTSRRAGMAESSRAQAAKDIQIADTMLKIADGIESGELTALAGIKAKTHVETLDKILRQAQYERHRKKYDSYAEQQRHEDEPISEEDITFAKMPAISLTHDHETSLVRDISE